jgi:hypothetical protein
VRPVDGLENVQSKLRAQLPLLQIDNDNKRIGNRQGLHTLETMETMAAPLKDLEARIKELKQQAEEKELQARRDLNRLLPFFTQTKLIRRGLLESYARHNLASYASSSLSRKIVEERNVVAHGGDVFSDIEVIDQEGSSETAEQWKWSFNDIYGADYASAFPVVPTAPTEIIQAFNIHGDTKLHRNQSTKRSIPDDMKRNLMTNSREIIDQWMASGIVDDELKAKCHALAAEYDRVWIW